MVGKYEDLNRLAVQQANETLAELERGAILGAMKLFRGDTAATARSLGISRRKVQMRLAAWGIARKTAERRPLTEAEEEMARSAR